MALFGFGKSKRPSTKSFKEPMNLAVYTTKFVVEEKKLITYVTHDAEDGAWQFFSDDEFEDFDAVSKIVGLGDIIKLDHTILEVADLPEGYLACRNSRSDKWKIMKQEE